ncbi:MAG TPA: DUF3107 domain-containing protein [Streptosporangiaceae bacterium]|jgi:hypothetical protein|nr:DUF3107 domain-containing protein [Streptosporangiaceae bacterium]
MQVRIGVQYVPKELVVETDQSANEVQQALADALNEGHSLFVIQDERGGRIVVPADRLAYLEIEESESRQVGFGTL